MATTNRYVRSIQAVYPVGKRSQIVGHWLYARLPYNDYKPDEVDELDNEIYNQVTHFAKENQHGWYLKEIDKGWEFYGSTYFKGKVIIDKRIRILPSLDTSLIIDPEIIKPKNLIPKISTIHFLSNRKANDPDMENVPQEVSVSISEEKFEIMKNSYQP
ncbi:MAG TPA: hypothetical protein VK806_13315 [Bacteroidia bacterium]|jgi:hypothetical protein|nr:hypothetical protein [Bacteroidia bacterium]